MEYRLELQKTVSAADSVEEMALNLLKGLIKKKRSFGSLEEIDESLRSINGGLPSGDYRYSLGLPEDLGVPKELPSSIEINELWIYFIDYEGNQPHGKVLPVNGAHGKTEKTCAKKCGCSACKKA